jgi:hypothetical protein
MSVVKINPIMLIQLDIEKNFYEKLRREIFQLQKRYVVRQDSQRVKAPILLQLFQDQGILTERERSVRLTSLY